MTESSEHAIDEPTIPTEGVLVGYDGSPAAGNAVRWAASEAERRGRPLVVVHAVDTWGVELDRGAASDDWSRRAMKAGGDVIDEGVSLAGGAAKGLRVRGMLGDGSPTRVLVEQSRGADLVVV